MSDLIPKLIFTSILGAETYIIIKGAKSYINFITEKKRLKDPEVHVIQNVDQLHSVIQRLEVYVI